LIPPGKASRRDFIGRFSGEPFCEPGVSRFGMNSDHICDTDFVLLPKPNRRMVLTQTTNFMSQPMPIEPEKLKPVLHEKIERMDAEHLSLFNRVLLQVEAEELADRLNDAFDADRRQDQWRRISELIQQFRAGHRYA
jgi:hypothetical protein